VLVDPWGDELVPQAARDAIKQHVLSALPDRQDVATPAAADAIVDAWLRANPAYATVITRSRYAEDALHAAVARGTRQYLLLGAGFDSYALRTPEVVSHFDIFEIDHPATQSLKRQRIAECGITLPDSVHFIAADLAAESLADVLARSALNPAEPAFVAWLGVTMYLPRAANLATLKAISTCCAPGSDLVFTYIDKVAFAAVSQAGNEAYSELGRRVRSLGEPFLCGFDPHELAADLQGVGLSLEEDLSDVDLVDRYDPSGLNGLRPSSRSRMARAKVVGR
jgi:methyltransferase (TIGR00027 family)